MNMECQLTQTLRVTKLKMDIWFLKKRVQMSLCLKNFLNQRSHYKEGKLVAKLGQVVTGFTNGYQSWKRRAANYEARIDEKIDKDFWKKEWEKEVSNFYTKE